MSTTICSRPLPPQYYSVSCMPCSHQPVNCQTQSVPKASALDSTGPVMKTTLGNGTQAYVMQKPGLHKSAFFINIPVNALPPGVDELLTISLMQGSMATKRRLEELREQGINIGASKGERYFSIWGEAPAGEELTMTNAVMGLLNQPTQDPAMFNTLKSNLIHIQQQQVADPDSLLDTAMTRRLYGPEHRNSRTPQQRASDIAAQSLPDVMAYHQSLLKLLAQGNTMMVSPLPAENQRQTLMAAFGNLSIRPDCNSAPLAPPVDSPKLGAHRNILLPNESIKRALIKVSWQVPDPRDPDFAAFCLLRAILCDAGKNSFFNTLRTDHGLVYAIQYDTDSHRLPQGRTFTPSVKVEFDKVGQAIEDIRNVTQNLCQNEINPTQLQSIQREQLLKLRSAGETSEATGEFYRPWLTTPGAQLPNLQNIQAAINRVTPSDVKRVANRIFNNPNGLQMMGVSAPTAVLKQWFPGQPLEQV